MTQGHRDFWCFISYRHADNQIPGRQWATWLHHSIETYEVPPDLIGTANIRGDIIPERIFPVFRDEEELPVDADLATPIYHALERSKLLVVICSPAAVKSLYVANEIRYFKQLGRADRVLAVIISGEPNASRDELKQASGLAPDEECFPEPLRHAIDPKGNLLPDVCEPIAADFRLPGREGEGWTTPEAYRQSLQQQDGYAPNSIEQQVMAYGKRNELMKLKVIAGILGVSLGDLTQRDKAFQLAKAREREAELTKWNSKLQLANDAQSALLLRACRLDHNAAADRFEGDFWRIGLLHLERALTFHPGHTPSLALLAFAIRYGTGDRQVLPAWYAHPHDRPNPIWAVARAQNAEVVLVADSGGRLHFLDPNTGEQLREPFRNPYCFRGVVADASGWTAIDDAGIAWHWRNLNSPPERQSRSIPTSLTLVQHEVRDWEGKLIAPLDAKASCEHVGPGFCVIGDTKGGVAMWSKADVAPLEPFRGVFEDTMKCPDQDGDIDKLPCSGLWSISERGDAGYCAVETSTNLAASTVVANKSPTKVWAFSKDGTVFGIPLVISETMQGYHCEVRHPAQWDQAWLLSAPNSAVGDEPDVISALTGLRWSPTGELLKVSLRERLALRDKLFHSISFWAELAKPWL
ncbi:MAG: hypothetical protein QOH88_3446 [Verrucomicrobiota bacterium]|jgi:hypothetical protein